MKKQDFSIGTSIVTSKSTLISNSGIFLITMNPGGSKDNIQHSVGSYENGCAYISESWKNRNPGESPLQKQFISLFSELAKRHTNKDKIKLMESSVCGYFIPFRSPNYKLLKNKKESISLAINIWELALSSTTPKLIICIDSRTYKYINEIIKDLDYNMVSNKKYPVGWGEYSAEVARYMKEGNRMSIIRFPHFSRFPIFGREASKEAIELILGDATKDLFEDN